MTPEQSRRAIFLDEVGIGQVWVRRHIAPAMSETAQAETPEAPEAAAPETVKAAMPAMPVMPVMPALPVVDAPAFEADFSA